MISRAALFVASLAAAFTLAFALAVAGFAPGATQPVPAAATAPVDPAPTDAVQVDTVYVAPPPPQQTVTINKVVAGSGGENETGSDD